MRRVTAVALAAVSLAVIPAAAASRHVQTFAFGRLGGNIRPFRVAITASGGVHVQGPVTTGRTSLSPAQRKTLEATANRVGFATLPLSTMCPGALPDVATTYVRVGARTVSVRGSCITRFTRLWNAVSAAVKLSY